jgi:hypothetical protein
MTWTRIRVGGVLVLDSQTIIDQLESYPEWGDSINRLECRVGAEPSYGTFLVPANALETIPTDGPFNIIWQYNDDATTRTVTFTGYSLIDSFTCANVHDSPLVITVGDARHNYAKAFTHKRFNCQRFFDRNLIEGTAASLTMPFSVAEIIDDILDDLPFSSLSMPSDRDLYNLYFDYTPAWQALSRVADLCGYRLGYDPYNGTPIAIELQPDPSPTALPSGVTRVNVTGDRLFQTPDYSDAANQLRVIFDRKPFHTDALTARQSHVLDRSGVSGAAPNTVEAIYATLLAESNDWTDHTANTVNYAAMMAEADWFASTYTIVQEIEANKQSKTFRGLYQIPLSHAVKSLAWQAIGAQTFTEWETGCDVPPSWLSPNTVHVGKSQYLFFTPEDGIPGRDPETLQAEFAQCIPFHIDGNGILTPLRSSQGEIIRYPVWNISANAIPGETFVLVRPISGRLVADPVGDAGAMIKFRARANIFNRTVDAEVIGGGIFEPGSTLEIFDPHNAFGVLTKNCIGFARYSLSLEKWEIVTAMLPANEVRVELQDTLLAKVYTPGELRAFTTDAYQLRSTYPNVLKPPTCDSSCTYTWDDLTGSWVLTQPCPNGCTCGPTPTAPPEDPDADPAPTLSVPCESQTARIEIEFENSWLLDGMCESYAILRRVANADWAQSNEVAPGSGSYSDFRWEVVQVEKKKARYIMYEYPGETDDPPSITKWWQGEYPVTNCDDELEIEYPIGEPCPNDLVIATYDPKLDIYYGYASRSAMYGEGIEIQAITDVANHDCGVTLTEMPSIVFKQKASGGVCLEEPAERNVELGTSTPVIVAMSSEFCGTINYAFQNIRAFLCGSTVSFADFLVNFDGVGFVMGAEFGPPSCSGNATWTFNTGTSDWDLTTPCSNGCEAIKPAIPDPLPSGSITATSACNDPINGQCGLNLTIGTICGGVSHVDHAALPLDAVDVVTEVVDNVTDLRSYKKRLYVCNFESLDDDIITTIEECPEP